MCNNRELKEREKYDRLGQLAARVLQGESLQDIADSEKMPLEVVEEQFREIKNINPYLYKQIFGEEE